MDSPNHPPIPFQSYHEAPETASQPFLGGDDGVYEDKSRLSVPETLVTITSSDSERKRNRLDKLPPSSSKTLRETGSRQPSRFSILMLDTWVPEIVAWILSTAAMVSVTVVLM